MPGDIDWAEFNKTVNDIGKEIDERTRKVLFGLLTVDDYMALTWTSLGSHGYARALSRLEKKVKDVVNQSDKLLVTRFLKIRRYQHAHTVMRDELQAALLAEDFTFDGICDIGKMMDCGCDEGTAWPGILLPCAPNGNEERAWVERCDECDLFPSDDSAAYFAARMLGMRVAYEKFDQSFSARPYLVGITFEDAEDINNRLWCERKENQKR